MTNVAIPAIIGDVPITMSPFLKVTVPDAAAGETDAVRVVATPWSGCILEEVSVVTVAINRSGAAEDFITVAAVTVSVAVVVALA